MAAADLSGSSFFRHLQCRDLHQYLGSLPSGILDRLYNHPAICLAVFRELPELAKQFVMRTLFADQPVPDTLVAAWVKTEHQKHYIGSLNRLKGLRIWKESSGAVPNRLEMNAIFRSNLKIALCGGGNPWIGSGDQPERDKHARDIPFLDKYSMERWEAVLHFMTGYTSTEEGSAVSQDVVKVLVLSGLMKCETPGNSPIISPAGFQFLLMDTASQVWYFMLQYLETVEGRGMDLVECLSFLFQISFASLGKVSTSYNGLFWFVISVRSLLPRACCMGRRRRELLIRA
ncbi:General transcription factor IIH subunit 4 [Desmophyllum pertusum]|uniref:General transcription factor IIH subunit 4 n=1 Tax=Desmophyllum pertusum TaxID=174260 RepID=A0A9X0CVC7_9CNID|nr:General transcription factor IIH subunit 4 [Desmophyllum pertusum]